MDSFVAACRPAGALLETQSMDRTTDENGASAHLLEMAFETEVRIPNDEQFGVNRTVRSVTGSASFADGLVLEDVGTALGGVTAEAAFVF